MSPVCWRLLGTILLGIGENGSTAQLYCPSRVAFDGAASLYIIDGNHRIRKATPAGVISTVAGNGTMGFSGDGGPATSAQLCLPRGVALDAAGNIYIADTINDRIRKVTPAGVISTAAGGGTDTSGSGPATSAMLSSPHALTLDAAGNIYIGEVEGERIRKVTPAGVVSTIAGISRWGFSGDGGPATSAQLNYPRAVALDAFGNLYISDSLNDRILRVEGVAGARAFVPQVAVGGGYTTVFTFGNTGSATVSGTLTLTDQQGNPLTVNGTVENPGTASRHLADSAFPIAIPPGGVGFITTTSLGINDAVREGWAQIDSTGGSLYSVATFQYASSGALQSTAGVLPSQPAQYATIPVAYDVSQEQRVGYAASNTGDTTITIKLAAVDQSGNVIDDSTTITLAPRQQIAKFLDQDLTLSQFKGSIVLRGQNGGTFAAIALVQN